MSNDCRICMNLTKLFIPGFDLEKYVIDFNYLGEIYRVKYPMVEPVVFPLKNIFTLDKNQVNITIMVQQAKKYRKIAKGEINIYRKYLLSEKLEIEKFVHLELYKTPLDKQVIGTSIISTVTQIGKVFMKACLIDPAKEQKNITNDKNKEKSENFLSLFSNNKDKNTITNNLRLSQVIRNNIKLYLANSKEKNIGTQMRSERFKSLAGKENDYLQNMVKSNNNQQKLNDKTKKNDNELDVSFEVVPEEENPYNDGLSDVSVTIIEGLEDDCVKIEEINGDMNDFILKVKMMFNEKFETILPSNNEELKLFVNKISKQIQSIAENYITNLEQLQEINNKIKEQAKIYYDKYKDKKREFKKERKDLKKKNQKLEEEITNNIEENKHIKSKFDDFNSELNYFKSMIGIKDEKVKMGKYYKILLIKYNII